MFPVFIVLMMIVIAVYPVSYRKYSETIKLLEGISVYAKSILPLGLFLLGKFKYGFNTAYDRKLMAMAAELYGYKKAMLMLRVHWGSKISLMLFSLLFALFIGIFTGPDAGFMLFCISLPIGMAIFCDRDLHEKVKKRRQALQLDFPDFVNKFTLLINAGMTVSKAWERIADDGGKQTPLYLEVRSTMQDIRSGIPEHKAYEEFAKRCRIPVITRFISVILQNIRKGNSELVPILRVYANECWELRKATARKYGEEASTKMLLPMMLMFVAILLIVGMPAVLALKNV